jgi:hypothetical protein
MDKQGKFEKMAEMMKSFCTGEGSMADCCSMMMKKMMQCCEGEKPEKKKESGEETSTKQT